MKRITRHSPKFDLMRLLDGYARARGSSIQDQQNQAAFLSDLTNEFHANRTNEILIHGLRTQAMFAFVAAALGRCTVIKEEDAGDVYTSNPSMRAPDFRILTTDGLEFFVEVKSHHPKRTGTPYSMGRAYFDTLRAYADTFGRPLYVAIYWSQLKLWTLVPAERLMIHGDHYVLTMANAFKESEMFRLGDVLVGTIPSLTLRLHPDPTMPHHVGVNGRTRFTVRKAELLCGEEPISEGKEREIAWFLMNYGNWPSGPAVADVRDGELISTSVTVSPEERANPDQHFEIVGLLSEMVSRQYNDITASSGRVDRLTPRRDPDELGVLIPPGFTGRQLRLLFFVVEASSANAV